MDRLHKPLLVYLAISYLAIIVLIGIVLDKRNENIQLRLDNANAMTVGNMNAQIAADMEKEVTRLAVELERMRAKAKRAAACGGKK